MISQTLKQCNVKKLTQLGKQYGQSIQFISVDDTLLRAHHLVEPGRLTIATYYRLCAAELLPESINKVLYLDGDIIVLEDLSQIWETSIERKAVAVVSDKLIFSDERQNGLQYPAKAGYFNAGVMLINLAFWRSEKLGPLFLDYIDHHSAAIRFHDQDVLNSVLWDKRILLPLTYNFQVSFLFDEYFKMQASDIQHEILATLNSPNIIHYNTQLKPWNIAYYWMPFYNVWVYYKRKSPWSHMLPSVPRRKRFNWIIKRYFLWPLGIMKPDMGLILP